MDTGSGVEIFSDFVAFIDQHFENCWKFPLAFTAVLIYSKSDTIQSDLYHRQYVYLLLFIWVIVLFLTNLITAKFVIDIPYYTSLIRIYGPCFMSFLLGLLGVFYVCQFASKYSSKNFKSQIITLYVDWTESIYELLTIQLLK